jgi:hypothetical protein
MPYLCLVKVCVAGRRAQMTACFFQEKSSDGHNNSFKNLVSVAGSNQSSFVLVSVSNQSHYLL